ncbi:carbohydrate-binding domain-containing protein [Roseomonas mucosa]|uniref:carbohydrate-binding domain-containing protein n=1 Tax=Roseomonas mucosa TaxID=207340 RepID=UPI0022451624|nr:carbohydrate-binding domain-containing protein [Roseomonas mucosa]
MSTELFEVLANNDITFSLLTSGNNGASLSSQISAIAKLESLYNAIDYVEGPNETDYFPISYNGLTGFAATRAFQSALYPAVHGNSALSGTPVIQTSLGDGNSYSQLGNLSSSADYSNIHSYYFGWGFTRSVADQVPERIAEAQTISPGKDTVATEGGWSTATYSSDGYGVNERTQAVLTLNMLLDQYKDGVDRTYIYELVNSGTYSSTNLQTGFGLFNADGTPKQAATALHNLNSILSDPAAGTKGVSLTNLGYTLQGMPTEGQDMLLQKSSGNYDLVLWNEPTIWNTTTHSAYSIASQTVTINFDNAQSGTIYDPLLGSTAIASFSNTKSVQVALSDHPLVVEVGTAATATVATDTATTGTNKIVLHVSEDAYQGDAQFVVRVDDKVVSDVLTATASHAAGKTQDITVSGDFGSGTHKVSVTYLNDLNGGSAGDRNLYVEGITVDGTLYSSAKANMTYNYTADFNLNFKASSSASSGSSTSSSTAGTTTSNVSTPNASSTDSITLRVSEDAYKGDAQMVVKVDGKQLGDSAYTVTASHADGKTQDITLHGDFTTGTHKVEVAFINDFYEGSASADRNLYLQGIDVNGTFHAEAAASLTWNHSVSYDLAFA